MDEYYIEWSLRLFVPLYLPLCCFISTHGLAQKQHSLFCFSFFDFCFLPKTANTGLFFYLYFYVFIFIYFFVFPHMAQRQKQHSLFWCFFFGFVSLLNLRTQVGFCNQYFFIFFIFICVYFFIFFTELSVRNSRVRFVSFSSVLLPS